MRITFGLCFRFLRGVRYSSSCKFDHVTRVLFSATAQCVKLNQDTVVVSFSLWEGDSFLGGISSKKVCFVSFIYLVSLILSLQQISLYLVGFVIHYVVGGFVQAAPNFQMNKRNPSDYFCSIQRSAVNELQL